MTDLNENHRRILFQRLKAIDHALFDLECALHPIHQRSPFRSRIAGLSEAHRTWVEDFSRRLRARMWDILAQKGALIPPDTVTVRQAAMPYLLTIEHLLEELGPNSMRGYGSLSGGARRELETIVSELQEQLAEFKTKING